MNEGNGNHGRAPRIMFLVGAGISIPVGIPAMQGIYAGFLRKEKSSITDLEQKTCKFLTENLKVRPDLEEFLLAANAITSFRNSPLAAFVEASVSNRPRQGLRNPRHDAGDDLQTGDVRTRQLAQNSRIQEDGSGHRRRSVHQWNRIRPSHRSMQARRLISTMPYTRFDNSSRPHSAYPLPI